MARTVSDVALFLSTIAGHHPPDPNRPHRRPALSPRPARALDEGGARGLVHLDGGIPFEPEITRVVHAQRQHFLDLGCVVEEAEPAFDGVDEAFPILRHLSFHANYAKLAARIPPCSRTR